MGVFLACSEQPIALEGQAGVPFPLAFESVREVPRAGVVPGACGGPAGGCVAYCTDSPDVCAANAPDACQLAVIDSASPFSMVVSDGDWEVSRTCLELRASPGLATAPGDADPAAVARVRFLEAPTLAAPTPSEGWDWKVGDERAPLQDAPVVVGGNLLREFAVVFRDALATPTGAVDVSFAREYPGSEASLADDGSVYLRLQYPSFLSGGDLDDQCQFEGADCNLREINWATGQWVSLLQPHRMVVDTCVAAPPCGLVYDRISSGLDDDPVCRLTPGTDATEGCVLATDTDAGGKNGTMVVATGLAGAALIEDSARFMLGPLEALPPCDDPDAFSDPSVRACVETLDGTFSLPGWPTHTGLTVLRVRSYALVSGNIDAKGPGACERLRGRLQGLTAQCIETLARDLPWKPVALPSIDTDTGLAMVGEIQYPPGVGAPDTDRWIRTVILPPSLPFVDFTRRDTGTDAAQVDGFLGTALMQETELVLDYTEDALPPGLRMRCMNPGSGRCLTAPACRGADGGTQTAGTASCCHGLPQGLLSALVRGATDTFEQLPRLEDQCCVALAPSVRAELEADLPVCRNQPLVQ